MSATVLIEAFEVPPDADDAFLAGPRPAGATVHRALRDDVDFRFVEVSRADAPADRPTPFASHAARYEVAHEDGAPDGSEGVVLINFFEVPPDADEAFVAGWGA